MDRHSRRTQMIELGRNQAIAFQRGEDDKVTKIEAQAARLAQGVNPQEIKSLRCAYQSGQRQAEDNMARAKYGRY